MVTKTNTRAFPTHSFPDDSTEYITPTWDELSHLAFLVSQKLRADGAKFDRVVTLAKGGWPMTRPLVDFLQVPEVASIGVKFYKGINQRLNMPEIYQDLPISVKGEDVLLFDDVADTGESLEYTKEHLLDNGVKSVTTAALYLKPRSSFIPDYYAAETDAWIVFPYDAVEMIKVLGKKWQEQNADLSEIRQRFLQLGISEEVIDSYLE